MQYSVVFHTAEEGGFWVEVPALPGCYSQGESVEESLRNVREAIELYLETLRDERGWTCEKNAEVDVGAIRESPLPGTHC
ncbi:MAG: type II toxin-antitoxin system HicB family antitoxin [Dehalococcoidia bacterium]|nr:type II toxin-antitoxin system HicB family antitoxin [Dehalococcoidia bacterium]